MTMHPARSALRDALAVALLFSALGGCAAAPSGSAADASEKKRVNAEKQEALQEMLEKGQRN
jgi:fructose-1,6-bisphosphatase/inositol monophosphatase family enzyme